MFEYLQNLKSLKSLKSALFIISKSTGSIAAYILCNALYRREQYLSIKDRESYRNATATGASECVFVCDNIDDFSEDQNSKELVSMYCFLFGTVASLAAFHAINLYSSKKEGKDVGEFLEGTASQNVEGVGKNENTVRNDTFLMSSNSRTSFGAIDGRLVSENFTVKLTVEAESNTEKGQEESSLVVSR